MVEYTNIPHVVGVVVSSRLATLHELSTVYGLEDMWLLLEVHQVDMHNTNLMNKDH